MHAHNPALILHCNLVSCIVVYLATVYSCYTATVAFNYHFNSAEHIVPCIIAISATKKLIFDCGIQPSLNMRHKVALQYVS